MKELSIEEKARRYDEAINVTTNLVKAGLIYEDAANQIFPQFNKSDDERIRKALISRFNERGELDGISYDDIRAWLEKQGEQKVWEHVEPVTEDEEMIDTIIYDLERHGGKKDSCYSAETTWLKSLKNRAQSQSQSKEWSEENEIWIDRACMLLDELNHLSTLTLAKIPSNVNDIISHLKSLKHR